LNYRRLPVERGAGKQAPQTLTRKSASRSAPELPVGDLSSPDSRSRPRSMCWAGSQESVCAGAPRVATCAPPMVGSPRVCACKALVPVQPEVRSRSPGGGTALAGLVQVGTAAATDWRAQEWGVASSSGAKSPTGTSVPEGNGCTGRVVCMQGTPDTRQRAAPDTGVAPNPAQPLQWQRESRAQRQPTNAPT
jgi:hypothetical protein